MVVSKQYADYVLPGRARAMAEIRFNKIASEVAVHAVVGAAGYIAGVAVGVDLHVNVAALRVIPAFAGWEQSEIALYDDADHTFGIVAELDHGSSLGPDDLQRGGFLRLRCREGKSGQCEANDGGVSEHVKSPKVITDYIGRTGSPFAQGNNR